MRNVRNPSIRTSLSLAGIYFIGLSATVVLVGKCQRGPAVLASDGALYSKNDPIQILTAETFYKNVLLSKTAWIVQFYSSWCGHCRNYATTWKQLAEEVFGWRRVIRLGAIDCADERNTPVCRAYQVIGYPTIKLFPPGLTSKKFLGVEVIGGSRHSVRDLRRKMADYVEEVKLKYEVDHFPSLEFFTNGTLPASSNANETRLLIFEFDGDELGRSVILDASLFKGIRAWRMKMSNPLGQAYGVKTSPVVIIVDGKNRALKTLDGTAVSTNSLIGVLKNMLGPNAVEETAPKYNIEPSGIQIHLASPSSSSNDDVDSEDFVVYERVIYMADLTNAVKYSLQHEVALHPNLTGDSLNALRKFLRIVATHFPDPSVRDSLSVLHSWVSAQNAITAEEWTGFFDKLDDTKRGLPPAVEYVGCKGSSRQYRGYPCGLWTLYHGLTIDAYRNDPKGRLGVDVLESLVGFVRHFFSCKYCSRHFQEMARESLKEAKDSKGSIMWLWTAHNKVNKRLAGDISEDPRYPKVQFPPDDLCSGCMDDARGTWNEEKVLTFLTKYYGTENIVNSNRKLTSVIVVGNDDRFELTSGCRLVKSGVLGLLIFILRIFVS